jgi:hypothetical protein
VPYDSDQHHPLGSYAVLSTTFGAAMTGALLLARRQGRELPGRISAGDVVLTGLATHKVTRLIAKDRVTSFVRAPFTEFQDDAGHGEIEERARGRGMQRAVGELLICPYCLAQWVAGAFAVGSLFAPRLTRLLTAMWTAQTLSDVAQLAYHAAEERS